MIHAIQGNKSRPSRYATSLTNAAGKWKRRVATGITKHPLPTTLVTYVVVQHIHDATVRSARRYQERQPAVRRFVTGSLARFSSRLSQSLEPETAAETAAAEMEQVPV